MVLRSLNTHVPEYDVLVVDDGSADNTAAVARRSGARVLSLPFNLGVGGAMQTGYLWGYENGYDVAVQFDGDGQHRADQIPRLVDALVRSGSDLVIGSRLLGNRQYRFCPARWIGSRVLVGLIRFVTGQRVTDPTSGFRALSRRAVGFFAQHYPQSYLGDTVEALAIAARHGLRIAECPARMRGADGSSIGNFVGFLHMLRVCVAVVIDRMERKLPMWSATASTEGG